MFFEINTHHCKLHASIWHDICAFFFTCLMGCNPKRPVFTPKSYIHNSVTVCAHNRNFLHIMQSFENVCDHLR